MEWASHLQIQVSGTGERSVSLFCVFILCALIYCAYCGCVLRISVEEEKDSLQVLYTQQQSTVIKLKASLQEERSRKLNWIFIQFSVDRILG